MPFNDAEFQKLVDNFAEFLHSGKLQSQERDYKEKLIRVLGAALTDEALASADFIDNLKNALREVSNEIINLTYFMVFDDFKKYINLVAQDHLVAMLRLLFDESVNLIERFDGFDAELNKDYDQYIEPNKRSGWLTALLLTARYPQTYIFYRHRLIKFAKSALGYEMDESGTRGKRYVAYLEMQNLIKDHLSKAWNRPTDLIDAHSFLWVESGRTMKQPTWKEALVQWLKTNPKTIPEELREQRAEFLERFPKDKISQMTLQDYALGQDSKDDFCNWLEFKTRKLGGIGGGNAFKWGVFWSRKDGAWVFTKAFTDQDDAISRIRTGLEALIKAADEGRFDDLDRIGNQQLGDALALRCKPLYLYFPNDLLPISQPEHLRRFLKIFGVEGDGGVLSLNRQLLSVLRGQDEFDGMDPHQMAVFLYDFAPSEEEEKRIWKIAPGPQAKHWDLFHDRECIAIAFLNNTDLRSFSDMDGLKQALLNAGEKSGSAGAIWRFTHRMRPGDIVVANKGIDSIVGIGRILSDYIPPKDPSNPSPHPEYTQARQVEWLINDPLNFSRRLFVQQTVGRVSSDDWLTIKQGYLDKYPNLDELFAELEGKEIVHPGPVHGGVAAIELSEKERELLTLTGRTRNIILYGPPGTGKTYLVSKFAEHFIRPQLKEAASAESQRTKTLQDLTWWQAIALAMSMDGKPSFTVPELLNTETMSSFAALKRAAKVGNSIWVQLQSHTSPESRTVNYSSRQQPYLFEKSRDSQWSLTSAGREYVEENLSEELQELKGSGTNKAKASDFFEFVTFHQSFAYEEFIEGLKPMINDEGNLSYVVRAGVFKDIAARAEATWRKHGESAPKYLLIIDEINRANIAKVFGELITLIEDDKRLGRANKLEVSLPYSGDIFGVPPNLYIIGTMNTADRSIALLDLALRRRFSFVEVTPDPSLLQVVAGVKLPALLTKLNERVGLLLDHDHRIGHSYLMVQNAAELHFAWFRRVLPLLQEYFYNDSERLYALLGDGFMKKVEIDGLPSELVELVDTDSPRYEIKTLSERELIAALSNY